MARLYSWVQRDVVRAVVRQYHYASPNHKVHSRTINSNLQLLHKESDSGRPRPLVLMYAWMAAKDRHKKKYADYYLDRGFNILHVGISPFQLLRPKKTQDTVNKINDLLLTDRNLDTGNILVHTFSVGAYVYGENIVEFIEKSDKFKPVTARIKGHIYDSPVGRKGIPEGLPKALTKNKLIINISSSTLQWYLNTFKDSVTKHYDLSEDTALTNQLAIPALLLYSKADPVGGAHVTEPFIHRMKSNGNAQIFSHCWLDSPHVSHMHRHPQEYMHHLDNFLEAIGIFTAPVK